MSKKRPIYPHHIRRITGSFSWIDHRFVGDGFLRALTRDELLLYYFLVTVGDKNGVSFYSYEKICALLKIGLDDYIDARDALIARDLIAFRGGVFQVLPLPKQCASDATVSKPLPGMHSLGAIFKHMGQES
jgi:hypothetical protein